MGPLAIAGLAAQGISSLFGAIQGAKMKREANKINPVWDFQRSKAADQMMGFAQQRLNSRNPMAEQNRRAIQGSQAGMLAASQRNTLDPSQALMLAAASQGQADQSLAALGNQDMAWEQMNAGNYMNALNAGIGQDNLRNQFMAEKYSMDMSQKNALRNAGNQSIVGAFSNIASGLLGASMLPGGSGKAGGIGNNAMSFLQQAANNSLANQEANFFATRNNTLRRD